MLDGASTVEKPSSSTCLMSKTSPLETADNVMHLCVKGRPPLYRFLTSNIKHNTNDVEAAYQVLFKKTSKYTLRQLFWFEPWDRAAGPVCLLRVGYFAHQN
jgi:hypothetical protein